MRAVEQEQAQHSITGSSDHMDQRFATLTRFTKSLVLFLSTASHVPPWLLSAPLTSLGTRTGGCDKPCELCISCTCLQAPLSCACPRLT